MMKLEERKQLVGALYALAGAGAASPYVQRGVRIAQFERDNIVKMLEGAATVIQDIVDPVEVWTHVDHAIPELGQWVLCFRKGHHMRMFQHTGWALPERRWAKEDGTTPTHCGEYTHWRPLPPGPESSSPKVPG